MLNVSLSRAAKARLYALRDCTVIRAPWNDSGFMELGQHELAWGASTNDCLKADVRLTLAGEREAAKLPPIPPEGAWLAAHANLSGKTMLPTIFR